MSSLGGRCLLFEVYAMMDPDGEATPGRTVWSSDHAEGNTNGSAGEIHRILEFG